MTDHIGTSRLDTKVVVWAALPPGPTKSEVLVQKRISEKNKYSFSKIIVTIFAGVAWEVPHGPRVSTIKGSP